MDIVRRKLTLVTIKACSIDLVGNMNKWNKLFDIHCFTAPKNLLEIRGSNVGNV